MSDTQKSNLQRSYLGSVADLLDLSTLFYIQCQQPQLTRNILGTMSRFYITLMSSCLTFFLDQ